MVEGEDRPAFRRNDLRTEGAQSSQGFAHRVRPEHRTALNGDAQASGIVADRRGDGSDRFDFIENRADRNAVDVPAAVELGTRPESCLFYSEESLGALGRSAQA